MRAILFILSLTLALQSVPASASFCSFFVPDLSKAEMTVLLKEGYWQEAFWRLQREGRIEEANELESKIVENLQTGKVKRKILIKLGPVYLVTFENGMKAIYKPGTEKDTSQEWLSYNLDKLTRHVFHVPVTVYRNDSSIKGSLQLYIKHASKLGSVPLPVWIFDMLVRNIDRKPKLNILKSKTNDYVAIDHGDAELLTQIPRGFKNTLLLNELYGPLFQPGRARIDDLKSYLEYSGHSIDDFRLIINLIDEKLWLSELRGNVPAKNIQAFSDTLKIFKRL